LEILDPGDRVLHTVDGLAVSELGAVRAALPAGLLPAGEYRLRLSPEIDDEDLPADDQRDEYRLRVEPAERGV
jgi:hypothetical protein